MAGCSSRKKGPGATCLICETLHRTAAGEAAKKLELEPEEFCSVVPAEAGTQGFHAFALGPRFRGGDDSIRPCCAGLTTSARHAAVRHMRRCLQLRRQGGGNVRFDLELLAQPPDRGGR